jgi:ABC-type branched-subunit amino acid transport system permease subunit
MWLYALGALFVIVTLFLPNGVVGFLSARLERYSRVAARELT